MNFYIQVWPNKTATLMLENGTSVWTYPNVETAEADYKEWHQEQQREPLSTDINQDSLCSAML